MRVLIIITGSTATQDVLNRIWEITEPIVTKEDKVSLVLTCAEHDNFTLLLPEVVERDVHYCIDQPSTYEQYYRLKEFLENRLVDLLIFYGDKRGHELAVKLSIWLGCGFFPDTYRMQRCDNELRFLRKTCGSNLEWEITANTVPFIITAAQGRGQGITESKIAKPLLLSSAVNQKSDWLLRREVLKCLQVNALESASRVLIGGLGLGGKAVCDKMRKVASRWHMVPGFTRPVAMNGWCHIDEIVGQSGCRTAPSLCIALGVSGSAAFQVGIAGAKTLIAVNRDPDAPIFKYAQVGAVADAQGFVDALFQLSLTD